MSDYKQDLAYCKWWKGEPSPEITNPYYLSQIAFEAGYKAAIEWHRLPKLPSEHLWVNCACKVIAHDGKEVGEVSLGTMAYTNKGVVWEGIGHRVMLTDVYAWSYVANSEDAPPIEQASIKRESE